jgi:hypothetical protein
MTRIELHTVRRYPRYCQRLKALRGDEVFGRDRIIFPERVLDALTRAGADRTSIVFEYFFSAHALSEETAIEDMRVSVRYWQEALARKGHDLEGRN